MSEGIKMSIRQNENYSNRNKYSERDVSEIRQAQAEQESTNDDFSATSNSRKAIVISGLVSKYGFSQAGAEATFTLIAKGVNNYGESSLDNAKFATSEMKQAAIKAFDYFWK